MHRQWLTATLCLLSFAGIAAAFEATGTIKKVDVEKGVLHVFAGGQDRVVKIAKDAKFLDADGKPLAEGLKSKELKEGAQVTLTVEREDNGPSIKAIRLAKPGSVAPKLDGGRTTVGLKPLTEMSADDKYMGEEGGLYGAGKNEPPADHLAAAKKILATIEPLDSDGKPAKDGKIGLISISMSNATQEFSLFKQLADKDERKSPKVIVVDCAQGGQTMFAWSNPKAKNWDVASKRLTDANLDPKQVQAAWIKLANAGPKGALAEHGKKLQTDTTAVLQLAKQRFPNLRVAYLGSRIYAGYATTPLNPEPYAYEGAFVVRWLIRDQVKGDAALNYDGAKGAVKAPLLLWGPYFWADGLTPRKGDGLIWERKDLAGDGTHPSQSGREKVADQLIRFFKSDPLASGWFAIKWQ